MKALIPALCIATVSHAQTLDWANGYGGAGSDRGNAIAVDVDGNTLLTGSFSNSFEFGAGSGITLMSDGGTDIFIAKVGPDGTLAWAFGIGGGWDDTGNAIATDPQGNVYVTGSFRGTDVDFDPGPGMELLTSQSINNDMFVCKFDPIGIMLWAISYGALADDWGNGIAVDDAGNAFVTGRFAGLNDASVLALDSDGAIRWAISFDGSSGDDSHAIALDSDANVYVAGEFLGTVDLDPGPDQVNVGNAGSGSDAFICKLDSSGNYLWSTTLISAAGGDQVLSLVVDGQGNVHGVGDFNGDPLTVTTPTDTTELSYTGATDAFILKLDPDGNLAWAGVIGGGQAQHAYAIAVDLDGYVYTAGYVNSTSVTDFDPGPGSYEISVGNPSMFLSVLNSAGQFECAMTTTSASGWDEGDGIALDGNGNLYLTGWFNSATDFDLSAGGTTELQTAGSDDIFVLKMTSSCSILLSKEELTFTNLLLAPNPVHDALIVQRPHNASNGVLEVFDLNGKRVLAHTAFGTTTTLDVSGLAPGIYAIKTAGEMVPMRFVKL